ncbi:NAD-dependent epimerase/dehydratase family protein [Leptolyngbya sp. KIOST-1]|uniref:NAD-dependent epimerase/dehydratase family protein n=1 Tax=Leptolyngbya sp. KIOST-1 TaxID=1229172 RepID=UPI0012E069E6|nr:NAD(P)-dependent oxidoreductase [Leptolyngbya sp. KIOST-1]
MAKRVLVTGCTGFVGPWVIKRILEIHPKYLIFGVSCSAKKPPEGILPENFFQMDLFSLDQIEKVVSCVKPDIVVHLASLKHASLSELFGVNVLGFQRLLECLSSSVPKARVVVIGSAAELGCASEEDKPLSEEILCKPVDNYGLTKQAQTSLAIMRSFLGQNIVCLRVFNLFGPNIPETLLPGRCAKLIYENFAKNESVVLEFGPLDTRRDYLDVRDLAKAIVLAFTNGESGKIYHIGSGENLSGHDVVRTLIKVSGLQRMTYESVASQQKPLVPFQTADVTRACQELSWVPQIDYIQSLRDTWSYQLQPN